MTNREDGIPRMKALRFLVVAMLALAPACAASNGPAGSTSDVTGAGSGANAASGTTTSRTIGATTSGAGTGSSAGSSGLSAGAGTGGSGTSGGTSGNPGTTGAPSVVFAIDMHGGPNRQYHAPSAPTAVSPYVYGFNTFGMMTQNPHTRWGILRNGGNGTTDWNWTNDYSNSAADYCFNQEGDGQIAGDLLVTSASADGIPAAQDAGIAYIATVPNVDFVAGPVSNNPYDQNGAEGQYACGPCPGTLPACAPSYASGNDSNTCGFALACDQTTCAANTNFVPNAPRKGAAFCTCAGSGCSGCQIDGDGGVFQDELVNYLKLNYGAAGGLFFMLDNEPNYWVSTHPEVWASSGTLSCQTGKVTFDDIVSRNIAYASAIKSVWPGTKVFGPVVAQDGIFYAGDYADLHLPTPFLDYYLGQMADAGVASGVPLLDSFDIHFYTVASSGSDCLQMPRSFWDPDLGRQYTESQLWDIYNGYDQDADGFFQAWYPPRVIPRVLGAIDAAYAGSGLVAPGFSISEYNFGCETAIEGGVAEADGLGVFGREGLFASTVWALQSLSGSYLPPAFDLYRNYDGAGATVGDLAVSATTSDPLNTSVYAFAHSANAQLELVAINKSSTATTIGASITNAASFTTATAYNLVDGNPAVVPAGVSPSFACSGGTCSLGYTLPGTSATTIVLR